MQVLFHPGTGKGLAEAQAKSWTNKMPERIFVDRAGLVTHLIKETQRLHPDRYGCLGVGCEQTTMLCALLRCCQCSAGLSHDTGPDRHAFVVALVLQ